MKIKQSVHQMAIFLGQGNGRALLALGLTLVALLVGGADTNNGP